MIVATCYGVPGEPLDFTFNLPTSITWLFQSKSAEELVTELVRTLLAKVHAQRDDFSAVRVIDDSETQWRVVLVNRPARAAYHVAVCDLQHPVAQAVAALDAIHIAHAPPKEAMALKYTTTAPTRRKAKVGTVLKTLDETKAVLHQTIDQVLARGEKLEDLVQRSERLSETSKMFYAQAKKHNSFCHRYCTIM